MKSANKILFSGGGSGGSVSPLLAVLDEMRASGQGSERGFLWIGTASGPERAMVESEGVSFKPIRSGKLRRYWSIKNVFDAANIVIGFFQALAIMIRWKPSCLLTAGSFVSVPAAWAAWLLRVPVLVHQQDLRPGLANRLMAPFAKAVTVTFEKSLSEYGQKAIWTGNPVRRHFLSADETRSSDIARELALDPALPVVAVIGGGQGARAINKLVPDVARRLNSICQIVHVTGKNKAEQALNHAVQNYYTVEFLASEKMASLLSLSQVAVSRAGMNFLTELACLGKASIIIPMPETHQEDNARFFSDQGAVRFLDQTGLDADKLSAEIEKMLKDEAHRTGFEQRISRSMKAGAAGNVFRVVEEIVSGYKQ